MNQESKFLFLTEPCFYFVSLQLYRLWSKVTAGLAANDMDAATDEKSFIENKQREDTAARHKEGLQWHPRFFSLNQNDEYEFKGVQG
jgi:hypothetical protein